MKLFLAKLILVLGDAAIFYAALALALFLRRPWAFSAGYFLANAPAFSAVFPFWILIQAALGLYDFRQMRVLSSLIGDMLVSVAAVIVLSTGFFYLFPLDLLTPKTHLVLTALFAGLAGFWWRRLWMRMGSHKVLAQRIAFLGDSALIGSIARDLAARRHSRFAVVAAPDLSPWRANGGSRFAGRGEGEPLKDSLDLVVVDSRLIETDPVFRETVLGLSLSEGIPVWTHLDFYEELYGKVHPDAASIPFWLLSHMPRRTREVYLYGKRALDLVLAALGLLLAAPLMAAVALGTKVFDPGPVFYSQRRLGYLERGFVLWKFRTMVHGAEREGYLWGVAKEDPRTTRWGRLLRRLRLDELPQLYNVLKGDMSLVGPRPTWVGEKQALDLPYYHLRHLIKPGITGWAQINSRSTNSLQDTIEKLQYDLYYLKHVSLGLDIAILLKTVRRVFQPEEAVSAPRGDLCLESAR